LGARTGIPIDSAMISDVPGYTWGTVTAMAQAGIRYFSAAPNYFDRIGTILVEWENKPFWWIGPDGQRFVIGSTSEAFRAFERRYGDKLPQVRGDWTPYWEDGAGSSAAETAMNRASSARLAQAETLWALSAPTRYPAAAFEEAWDNVLLYSEHTRGAYCSVSQPASPFTTDQWAVKQAYAAVANLQSRQLLGEAVLGTEERRSEIGDRKAGEDGRQAVDVYNTTSWERSEVVLVPRELSDAGNFVTDENGLAVPAQRLADGELAVLVNALPPFSGRRYTVAKKGASPTSFGRVAAEGEMLDNGCLRDRGPLVASLMAEADAPGCHTLAREVRLVAGGDYVECVDMVDKKRLEARDYHVATGKESVNIAFGFNVPGGVFRLGLPFGVIVPNADQIPSACKNWLTVGRWADVANRDYGVTWVTLDAPLVQLGGLTAKLLNSQTDPEVWLKTVGPTQKLVSWAMNNHWGTNYRAYQEGPVRFRFVLRPHGGSGDDAEAARFAAGFSQPLVAVPGRGEVPDRRPLLTVTPSDVRVGALKPSDDGRAIIVRLYNEGCAPAQAKLTWGRGKPKRMWLSDTGEREGKTLKPEEPVVLLPSALVTLRAEFAE